MYKIPNKYGIFQVELDQTEVMMRESLRMLLFEPLATPEGQLSRNMLRELKELKDDIKLLQEPNDDVVH